MRTRGAGRYQRQLFEQDQNLAMKCALKVKVENTEGVYMDDIIQSVPQRVFSNRMQLKKIVLDTVFDKYPYLTTEDADLIYDGEFEHADCREGHKLTVRVSALDNPLSECNPGMLEKINIRLDQKHEHCSKPYNQVFMIDPIRNSEFHEYNNKLIELLIDHPQRGPPRGTGEHVVVITDPRTDPTEDDATGLCALLGLDKIHRKIQKITALVTGGVGSLDARAKGIEFIKQHHPDVTIQCCPIAGPNQKPPGAPCFDSSDKGRFTPPYGAGDDEVARQEAAHKQGHGYTEAEAMHAQKHIVDYIPDDTTVLICIGQVPVDFFPRLTGKVHSHGIKLKAFTLQGPGFNTMPMFGMTAEIGTFMDTVEMAQISNNMSGLTMSIAEAEKRFELLGKLNPDIPKRRNSQLCSFWATSGRANQFQGQFGDQHGYRYAEHTAELLNELLQNASSDEARVYIHDMMYHINQVTQDPSIEDTDTGVLDILTYAWTKEGWRLNNAQEQQVSNFVMGLLHSKGLQMKTYDELNVITLYLSCLCE